MMPLDDSDARRLSQREVKATRSKLGSATELSSPTRARISRLYSLAWSASFCATFTLWMLSAIISDTYELMLLYSITEMMLETSSTTPMKLSERLSLLRRFSFIFKKFH